MHYLSPSSNAVVAVDAVALFGSELGRADHWQEDYRTGDHGHPLLIPPDAKRVVLGMQLDLDSLTPTRQVASIELARSVSAGELAERLEGLADSISGVDAVWLKSGACVVIFAPNVVGIMAPADRQTAARWVRDTRDGDASELPEYLRKAVQESTDGSTEIRMALDLEDAIRPEAIRQAVARSQSLPKADSDQIAKVLTSLRGVSLSIQVGREVQAELVADFATDTQVLQPHAKPFFLEVLTNAGAMIDEFNDWDAVGQRDRIGIAGRLTPAGMRKVLSLASLDAGVLTRPSPPESSAAAAPPAASPAAARPAPSPSAPAATTSSMALPTLRYFQNISRCLSDLERTQPSSTWSSVAYWMSNYSRKIRLMSTRNVDPDAITYGESVANLLDGAVANIHGVTQRTKERTAAIQPKTDLYYGFSSSWRTVNYGGYRMPMFYRPFAYGGVDIGSAITEREKVTQEEYDEGAQVADQIMSQLESETTRIRQALSERYGMKF